MHSIIYDMKNFVNFLLIIYYSKYDIIWILSIGKYNF
jgi:hypothetical protein